MAAPNSPADAAADTGSPPAPRPRISALSILILLLVAGGLAAAVVVAIKKSQSQNPQNPVANDTDTAPANPIRITTRTAPSTPWHPPVFTDRQAERDAMVDFIGENYGFDDADVLDVLDSVPRHEFVPAEYAKDAYTDSPLPIPNGQLISQPFIVAEMTSLLHLTPHAKVLEIGTGSGYQAAVLSNFTENVFTIEIIRPLAEAAAARLKRLGYDPIQLRIGDGFNGWPDEAPFNAIIVTCAAGQIPPPLIKQLAKGGRMIIPVGAPFAQQSLMLVEKDAQGSVHSRDLEPVRFVPLLDKDPSAADAQPQH